MAGESADKLRVTSLTDFWLFSLSSIVRPMSKAKARARDTIPVGMRKKEIVVVTRAAKMKLNVELSSMFFFALKAVARGRRSRKIKDSEPIKPVVVIRVKIKLLDSEKRTFQIFLFRFK